MSDAGGLFGADEDPARDWGQAHDPRPSDHGLTGARAPTPHRRRAFKSQGSLATGFLYISTTSDFTRYPQNPDRPFIPVSRSVVDRLARIKTRLNDMPDDEQELLINWGYAAADAAMVAFWAIQ